MGFVVTRNTLSLNTNKIIKMCKVSRRTNAFIILGSFAVAVPVIIFIFQDHFRSRAIYKYVISYGIILLWPILLVPTIYFIYMKKRYIRFLVPYAFIWLVLSSLIFIFFLLNMFQVLDYIYFYLDFRTLCIIMFGVFSGFMTPVSFYCYYKRKMLAAVE